MKFYTNQPNRLKENYHKYIFLKIKSAIFTKQRIHIRLNQIKKRYRLMFNNPQKLTLFKNIHDLYFSNAYADFQKIIENNHKNLFFSAGLIDQLDNGQLFFLGISQRTFEWIDVYLCSNDNIDVHQYRYHIFERYWQKDKKPYDTMQIHATINICLDEILYIIAKNTLFSPFKTELKLPDIPVEPYNPYKIL